MYGFRMVYSMLFLYVNDLRNQMKGCQEDCASLEFCLGRMLVQSRISPFCFLANSLQPSGSTGTFAFAIPSTDSKTVELRVVHSAELSR